MLRLKWIQLAMYLTFSLNIGYLCAQPPQANKAGPSPGLPVEVVNVKIDTILVKANAIGSLRAEENVIVRPEIAGRILTLHFSEGQLVSAGTTLVTLDPSEYEAQLSESTAVAKSNQINFERLQDLFNKRATSRQELDDIRAKLDESLARQALDQVRLEKTQIRAPFKGVLGLRNISQGAYVTPGQDLVTLSDITSLKLDFRIPERFLTKVSIGQTVEVQVDAYPKQTFIGKVFALDPKIDEETRTILLRARILNPNGELLPGMFARVLLVLEQRKNALVVPEHAIVPQGNNSFVYKVVDGKAVRAKVTLGTRRTGDVEIIQGLNPQDKIIIAGQMKLQEGMPVIIVNEPKQSPLK